MAFVDDVRNFLIYVVLFGATIFINKVSFYDYSHFYGYVMGFGFFLSKSTEILLLALKYYCFYLCLSYMKE